MDGNHSVASPSFDEAVTPANTELDPMRAIAQIESEAKVFALRVESMLSAIEQQGACQPYQAQVARALLSGLLDAIDELRPPRNSYP